MKFLQWFHRPPSSVPTTLHQERRNKAAAFLDLLSDEQYNHKQYGTKEEPGCLIGHLPLIFPTEWSWVGNMYPQPFSTQTCHNPMIAADAFFGRRFDYFLPKNEMIKELVR